MSVFRNAVFTWNNYPDDVDDLLRKLPDHSYLVYGYEVGESGTPHIQGYVEFVKQVRFESLKKKFPRVHWEKRRGNAKQASEYCKKEQKRIVEEGQISQQGKRTDIDEVRDLLDSDQPTMRNVLSVATSYQSVRFAEIYLKYNETKRNFKPVVTWIYGPPGVGKTSSAHQHALSLGLEVHLQVESAQWWEEYDATSACIMDDVRSSFCTFVRMCNLLDRYACRVPCKGGSRQFLARYIYLTSPCPPQEVWCTLEDKDQLLRRIDNIIEIKSCTETIVHKGNGIPIFQKEDNVEAEAQHEEEDSVSEYSYKEVCSEINA